MENYLIGIYKEVGKTAEFKKVENTKEELKKLVGGEFGTTTYNDFLIIYKKDDSNLKPNIYINNGFMKIGKTIRGNLFIVKKDFKSLKKVEAVNLIIDIVEKSFNYDKKAIKEIYKKNFVNNCYKLKDFERVEDTKKINSEETLKMILGMQTIILKFIKENFK